MSNAGCEETQKTGGKDYRFHRTILILLVMPATVSHYETDAPPLQMQMLHTIRRVFAEEPADISATDLYDARLLKKESTHVHRAQ